MYHRKYLDEEYFENLLDVWMHYGRRPNWSEMKNAPSKIGPDGYQNRFGGWRKALEAFVNRMNQNEGREKIQVVEKERPEYKIKTEIKQYSVSVEDRRKVPYGLRWKVLVRDKHRCVKCGAIPVLNPDCGGLEADHVIPFSKGGKTTLDNLQLLCKKCNLGKSNRHLE
ncbi:MAG: hypothetical protein A2787_05745 [Omnitrophica WOR_2 bacterium RIFCSPHIGHO2_01_FULL_48_9]|nr:MAG: hypothetical protein A3D10_08935 [Omnitrophica WOR_2 bacterium RIFCSPHIGHO2_02_FULL_48_11]OGX30649.1 MAG: hypothetical protein A2787_05745 [Omnitrophica WOR_2 bacterium RIFCSPHIGHO2_01_FULL_48_9]